METYQPQGHPDASHSSRAPNHSRHVGLAHGIRLTPDAKQCICRKIFKPHTSRTLVMSQHFEPGCWGKNIRIDTTIVFTTVCDLRPSSPYHFPACRYHTELADVDFDDGAFR